MYTIAKNNKRVKERMKMAKKRRRMGAWNELKESVLVKVQSMPLYGKVFGITFTALFIFEAGAQVWMLIGRSY